MKWLAAWWGQADHFDWLTGYLQAHGLSSNTRRIMAVVAASLVLVPANVWLGPAHVYRPLALTYSVVAAVSGGAWRCSGCAAGPLGPSLSFSF